MRFFSTALLNTLSKLAAVAAISMASCSGRQQQEAPQLPPPADSGRQRGVEAEARQPDTFRRFTPDDYPITNDMLDDTTSNSSSFPRQSGPVHSGDNVWFTSKTLGQTLVITLYTDKHRMVIYHFSNGSVPRALIDRMELSTSDGNLAPLPMKQHYFSGFFGLAAPIDAGYFTSNKGIRLGDSKSKILSIYGPPDSSRRDEGLEILDWDFVGDTLYDGKKDLKGKPLAELSFGHQARLFFKGNKLVAVVLHNDIP